MGSMKELDTIAERLIARAANDPVFDKENAKYLYECMDESSWEADTWAQELERHLHNLRILSRMIGAVAKYARVFLFEFKRARNLVYYGSKLDSAGRKMSWPVADAVAISEEENWETA